MPLVGSLPAGVDFNANTRVISGTPTAVSSGTVTIRASNSEGDDDWTIDYATTAAVTSNIVTVTLPNSPMLDNICKYLVFGFLPVNQIHLGISLSSGLDISGYLGYILSYFKNSG